MAIRRNEEMGAGGEVAQRETWHRELVRLAMGANANIVYGAGTSLNGEERPRLTQSSLGWRQDISVGPQCQQ